MSASLRNSMWVGVVICMAGAAYYMYMHFHAPPQQEVTGVQLTDENIPAPGFVVADAAPVNTIVADDALRTVPQGALEYRNTLYHVSLFYPDSLTVKTYDEGKGATTITFQNVATAQGFQLFVVPYTSTQISKARFMQDEPSGVMQNPLNVTIGGASATSFYGTDAFLGDTAEIWFIRGGYLYEVTAPKSEAVWLSDIMNTWRFI